MMIFRPSRPPCIVHDRVDVWARLIKSGMNEAFQVWLSPLRFDGIAVERKLHDIAGLDTIGRACAR